MIKKIFSLLTLLLISNLAFGQNIRGFYLQDVGDWLGNNTEENKILQYANGNGFNYILFYDLGDINWNSSTEKNKLAAFMAKARNNYGIIQIGGVVEYAGYVSQKIIPYNNSRTSSKEKFNVINLEFEFWVSSSISSSYCNKFLTPGGFSCNRAGAWAFAWREFKLIDDLCANNGMISEFYLGWPTLSEMQKIASRADRILLSAYRPTDSDIYLYSEQRMRDIASIGGTTKILTLLSSESSFMGPWLNTHPQNRPYQTFSTKLNAETESFKNNINLQGYQWFTYKYMPHTNLSTCIQPAVPTISHSGSTTIYPGQSITLTCSQAGGYLWSNGRTSQSISVSSAGSYTVRAYNGPNCYSTSLPKIIVMGTTNVNVVNYKTDNKNNYESIFSVYPNPANDELNLNFNLETQSKAIVFITDVSGKTFLFKNIDGNLGTNNIILNIEELETGLYFIYLIADNKKQFSRIVVN